MTEDGTCGEDTRAGLPCAAYPMARALGGGKCLAHAFEPTDAQREAAATNATTNGFFCRVPADKEEAATLQEARKRAGDDDMKRDYVALGVVRAERTARWEGVTGIASSEANAAYAALGRALAQAPPPSAAPHQCLDEPEVTRQVGVLMRDPEMFLRTLELPVAEAVRKVLLEKGVLRAAP